MRRFALTSSLLLLVAVLSIPRAVAEPAPFGFAKPFLVDPERAGGEPSIFQITTGKYTGEYLYASHAGTTHLYRDGLAMPLDFVGPYRNQTYIWRGATPTKWSFVDIHGTGFHSTATGFSDPDFAQDDAGNVYETEIDLVNVAVSSSNDGGQTWTGQAYAQTGDRPWLAAQGDGIVYLALDITPSQCPGMYTIYKSTDHGLTFPTTTCPSQTYQDGSGLFGTGKPIVDTKTHALLQPALLQNADGTNIGVGVEKSTDGANTFKGTVIDKVPHLFGFFPSPVTEDAAGNLYLVWGEARAKNPNKAVSVDYAYSTDHGATWSAPIRVGSALHDLPGSPFWPWAAAGQDGRLGIAWYQSDKLTNLDTHKTNVSVYSAQILDAASGSPSIALTDATGVVHRGQVCLTGTTCVATGKDRRLGDYLTCFVDLTGRLLIAYSNTALNPDSPVSRPGLVIQDSGPGF